MIAAFALNDSDQLEPIFHTWRYPDYNFKLEASGRVLRVENSIINFTVAEGKIFAALTDAAKLGLNIKDIPILLNKSTSTRSVHVVQAHISNIRRKIKLITISSLSIIFTNNHQRYFLISE